MNTMFDMNAYLAASNVKESSCRALLVGIPTAIVCVVGVRNTRCLPLLELNIGSGEGGVEKWVTSRNSNILFIGLRVTMACTLAHVKAPPLVHATTDIAVAVVYAVAPVIAAASAVTSAPATAKDVVAPPVVAACPPVVAAHPPIIAARPPVVAA